MKLYGLIGRPLTHSFSKAYFTKKFEQDGISGCRYENFELSSIHELPAFLKAHANLQGLNVTIPYKREVLLFLHTKNEIVEAVGACNCIKIENGKLYGYNTDVVGFQYSLQIFLASHHSKALVLGTGGSSGAVQYALTTLGIAYKVVSRQKGEHTITYADLDQTLFEEYTIVINTTPVGMYPHTGAAPELPYQFITSRHLLFDLIYNPMETLFLKQGRVRGAATANGHAMLLLQAEASWTIWNR